MKAAWLLFAMLVAGCAELGALAPDNAIGTYRGAVMGRGYCPSQAGVLTVNIAKSAAYGDWQFQQPNLQAQFGLGWVYGSGFLSSRRAPQGGMEYVGGYCAPDGSSLAARIDTGACIYNGVLLRT